MQDSVAIAAMPSELVKSSRDRAKTLLALVERRKREIGRVAMEDGVVLDIRFVAVGDGVYVTACNGSRPKAGSLADGNVSNDLGAWIDVGRSGNLGYDAAIGTNHD